MSNQRDDVAHDSALEISDLTFEYPGKRALDQVSLSVPLGQFSVLLGANGAGKTTLYSLVTRLYSPQSGSIRILGHDLNQQTSSALAGIGVVFQRPTLDLDLTVIQNLRYYAALHGLDRSQTHQRIDAGISQHRLEDVKHRKIIQLSGGQRRRVELLRALLHNPKLLLMDEPTVGLDIRSRGDFLSQVRGMCREGVGVLWATHLVDEVESTDHLFVLHHGNLIASGEVEQVQQQVRAENVGQAFELLTNPVKH